MFASRRGFFRAILALPFAPKCIQAYRRPQQFTVTDAVVSAYKNGGHIFYDTSGWSGSAPLKKGDIITMDVVYLENPRGR